MARACGKGFILSMSCVQRPAAPRMSGQIPTHRYEVWFKWREPVGKDSCFQCRAYSARLRRACQDKSRPTRSRFVLNGERLWESIHAFNVVRAAPGCAAHVRTSPDPQVRAFFAMAGIDRQIVHEPARIAHFVESIGVEPSELSSFRH